MLMACFDMEGVFLPEIWIEVSKITGIKELSVTTRDIKDYDELMTYRLKILREHGIGIAKIQEVIAEIKPVEGAREFLDWARSVCQVTILSDTFYEFVDPLMPLLGRPALFCHTLKIENGMIEDYCLRLKDPKTNAIRRFRELNFETFATGDSYNDTGMIQEADHACFFRAPQNVLDDFPAYKGVVEFSDLQKVITEIIEA
jgi:phosphoserine/homoserine phosphotransferase